MLKIDYLNIEITHQDIEEALFRRINDLHDCSHSDFKLSPYFANSYYCGLLSMLESCKSEFKEEFHINTTLSIKDYMERLECNMHCEEYLAPEYEKTFLIGMFQQLKQNIISNKELE